MKLGTIAAAAAVVIASLSGGHVVAVSKEAKSVDAAADASPSAKTASSHEVQTEASRKALEGFIDLLGKGDVVGAFERYTTENYTQHMGGVAPGRAGAIAYIQHELARGGTTSVLGFVADGNMVGVHLRQQFTDGSPSTEVIELWRVENGRLAEHWGAKKDLPATASSNPK